LQQGEAVETLVAEAMELAGAAPTVSPTTRFDQAVPDVGEATGDPEPELSEVGEEAGVEG
jgi:hypothetical protein